MIRSFHSVISSPLLVAAAGFLAGVGCSAHSDAAAQTGTNTVDIYSWWVSGSESKALTAMLDVYRSGHAGVNIINAAVTGTDAARQELQMRMVQGLPPDTFQANGGLATIQWVKYNGTDDTQTKLEPLDALAASGGWETVMPKPVLDTLSYNGHIYAVPTDIHRLNCLFYNKQIFADNNLLPPTNFTELWAVADALKAKNITPIALGSQQSWTVGTLMWENMLIDTAGPQYYVDFLSGKKSASDPEIKAAVQNAAKVLSYVNADANQLTWDQAVALVANGQAAMNFMGDWAKGEFQNDGKVADVDFGEATSWQDSYVFVTDVFVLPKGAPDRKNAIDLLTTMGSVAGQDAFNPIKGSIPARTDIDPSRYDSISQGAIQDFTTKTLVPASSMLAPDAFNTPVGAALGTFSQDLNVDNMLLAIKNYYDVLAPM